MLVYMRPLTTDGPEIQCYCQDYRTNHRYKAANYAFYFWVRSWSVWVCSSSSLDLLILALAATIRQFWPDKKGFGSYFLTSLLLQNKSCVQSSKICVLPQINLVLCRVYITFYFLLIFITNFYKPFYLRFLFHILLYYV